MMSCSFYDLIIDTNMFFIYIDSLQILYLIESIFIFLLTVSYCPK